MLQTAPETRDLQGLPHKARYNKSAAQHGGDPSLKKGGTPFLSSSEVIASIEVLLKGAIKAPKVVS